MSEDICSSRQFTSTDKAANANFSSAVVDGSSARCEAPPPPAVQCDLDEMILNSIALTRQRQYGRYGGKWGELPINPGTRAISLRGIDPAAPKHSKIEVVGDRSGAAATTKIRATIRPFAVHDASHVEVTVTRPNEPNLVKHCPGTQVFDFEVYREDASMEQADGCLKQAAKAARSVFQRYFTMHLAPSCYTVSAQSCGVRNSGDPVVAGVLDVLVYPYDQYSLTLTLPPLGRRSYSRSSTHTLEGSTNSETDEMRFGRDKFKNSISSSQYADGSHSITKTDSSTTNGTETTHKSYMESNEDSDLTSSSLASKKADSEITFEVKKNGAVQEMSQEVVSLMRTLKNVEAAVASIRQAIKNWVPQAGFKFDMSISFMQGSVTMGWGWKEYTDWQAYFAWVASVKLTLFKIALSVSFGISTNIATIKVSGTASDEVNLATQWEFNSPAHKTLPDSARAAGNIAFDLRGEASVDIVVARVATAAGVRTGFSVEGGFRLNPAVKPELYATIVWSGLDAYVQTQEPGGGLAEHVAHLIDMKNIWTGTLPI